MPKGVYIRTKPIWNKGLTKETNKIMKIISNKLKGNNLWDNPNSRRTQFKKGISPLNKGKTKESYEPLKIAGEKISKTKNSKEWREIKLNSFKKKMSAISKGKHYSPETEFKKGEHRSPKTEITKEDWKNPEYRRRVLNAIFNGFKPNKPEKIMIELIEKNNFPFNYTGNGKMWFKGENYMFNPDFLSKNPKHIIEVFGDYWHRNTQKRDKERLETYSRYGYKTLVIWEHELKNSNNVLNKIREFLTQNC